MNSGQQPSTDERIVQIDDRTSALMALLEPPAEGQPSKVDMLIELVGELTKVTIAVLHEMQALRQHLGQEPPRAAPQT